MNRDILLKLAVGGFAQAMIGAFIWSWMPAVGMAGWFVFLFSLTAWALLDDVYGNKEHGKDEKSA